MLISVRSTACYELSEQTFLLVMVKPTSKRPTTA